MKELEGVSTALNREVKLAGKVQFLLVHGTCHSIQYLTPIKEDPGSRKISRIFSRFWIYTNINALDCLRQKSLYQRKTKLLDLHEKIDYGFLAFWTTMMYSVASYIVIYRLEKWYYSLFIPEAPVPENTHSLITSLHYTE